MHDIAPARLATDDDVWTSDGVVLPWRPSTATDEVILVSVTGSDTALEEFPSELDEFPSERDGRLHASPADGVDFASEDADGAIICVRTDVSFAPETPSIAQAASHRSVSSPSRSPRPIGRQRLPGSPRRINPKYPVAPSAPRDHETSVDHVERPHRDHWREVRTQRTFSSRRPRSYRRVIGAGVAAALLVVTAMTVDWARASLFYSDTGDCDAGAAGTATRRNTHVDGLSQRRRRVLMTPVT